MTATETFTLTESPTVTVTDTVIDPYIVLTTSPNEMRLVIDDSLKYKGFALGYNYTKDGSVGTYDDGDITMQTYTGLNILVDANLVRYVVVSTDNNDISKKLKKTEDRILILSSAHKITVDTVNLVIYTMYDTSVEYTNIVVRANDAMLRMDEGNVEGNLDFLVE